MPRRSRRSHQKPCLVFFGENIYLGPKVVKHDRRHYSNPVNSDKKFPALKSAYILMLKIKLSYNVLKGHAHACRKHGAIPHLKLLTNF